MPNETQQSDYKTDFMRALKSLNNKAMFVLLYLFEEIFHYTYFIIHTMHMYISSINARLVFIKKKLKKKIYRCIS